ncbi:hypothetical protein NDU88_006658 [Pleurodeles waltl]|uniref:Uncharacterized protein n=1 Tax=Pleurodeles waltl TaxID=8319 RepID=A0AAV7MZW8_PLEWA|nr:hypothetical protein NDU88_006658 [Pleurodeles waltl]
MKAAASSVYIVIGGEDKTWYYDKAEDAWRDGNQLEAPDERTEADGSGGSWLSLEYRRQQKLHKGSPLHHQSWRAERRRGNAKQVKRRSSGMAAHAAGWVGAIGYRPWRDLEGSAVASSPSVRPDPTFFGHFFASDPAAPAARLDCRAPPQEQEQVRGCRSAGLVLWAEVGFPGPGPSCDPPAAFSTV